MITGEYEVKTKNNIYNPIKSEFKIGDKIIEIEGKEITTISELSEQIKNSGGLKENFDVIIIRNNKRIHKTLKVIYENNQFTTGLYVKDAINGIGTITFYNPDKQSFGALGHAHGRYCINH